MKDDKPFGDILFSNDVIIDVLGIDIRSEAANLLPSRLALSKWHTARAMTSLKKETIRANFIEPWRQEITKLRAQLKVKTPRR